MPGGSLIVFRISDSMEYSIILKKWEPLDNCTKHLNTETENTKMFFFLASTTAFLQPLDQGVIKILQTLYRNNQQKLIFSMHYTS